MQNSVTSHQSEQATSDHQERAQPDQVAVTFIGIPGWALHWSNMGGTITNLRKKYTTLSLSAKGTQNSEL